MFNRTDLYRRYGVLLDRVVRETSINKKTLHSTIKSSKGVSSLKELSDKELWILQQELIGYLASELGVEFYFGEDHSSKTLHELNKERRIE